MELRSTRGVRGLLPLGRHLPSDIEVKAKKMMSVAPSRWNTFWFGRYFLLWLKAYSGTETLCGALDQLEAASFRRSLTWDGTLVQNSAYSTHILHRCTLCAWQLRSLWQPIGTITMEINLFWEYYRKDQSFPGKESCQPT